jgi:hypothetical protein
MTATDLVQATLRAAHLISLASLFGTLVSLVTVLPAALTEAGAGGEPARCRLVRLARWSAALALATGLSWLVVQAVLIADANSVLEALDALPIVAAAHAIRPLRRCATCLADDRAALPLQKLDGLVLDRVLVPEAGCVNLACRIGRAAHCLLLPRATAGPIAGNLKKAARSRSYDLPQFQRLGAAGPRVA